MNRFNKPSQDTPDSSTLDSPSSRAPDSATAPVTAKTHQSAAASSSGAIPGAIQTATAVVHSATLLHNLSLLKQNSSSGEWLLAIKANAYGHGLVEIAKLLNQHCDYLGVARLGEALQLRQAGISGPIVMLSERLSQHNASLCAEQQLTPCLFDEGELEEQLALIERYQLPYWLKLNTGMNRLGIGPHALGKLAQHLQQKPSPQVLLSHLSAAEAPDNRELHAQLERFAALYAELRLGQACKVSIANSAASLKDETVSSALQKAFSNDTRPAGVINRIGIALYGSSHGQAESASLQPALSLYAPVLSVMDVAAGQSVGYNGLWTASRPSRIATLGIGYGDGYPRHAGSGTPVLFGDERASVAGRVSMDMIGVDITDLAQRDAIRPGHVACLWGQACSLTGESLPASQAQRLSVEEIAEQSHTISYQLLCQLSNRVERVYC